MKPLDRRFNAIDWLFAATKQWLFWEQNFAKSFPRVVESDLVTIGNLAYFHNMEPLLYWMISNARISIEIPEWLRQKWEQAYFENFLRNDKYLGILRNLLAECEKEEIPIIVLKGPALIGRIYNDTSLRILSDLDILCSQKDLCRIVNISSRKGYTIMIDGDGPSAFHHVAMYQAESGTLLEFHYMPYEVIQNHSKFMQMAWDRREWVDIGDVHCPVLCLEMELLFNIAHMATHQFDVSLKHFVDIAGLLVLYRRELKVDGIGSLLREFGLEQAFSLTNEFLSTMMGLPRITLSPSFNHKDNAHKEFVVSLRNLLALLDEDRLLDLRGAIWRFQTAIENRKGLGNKVDYVVKTLFPFSRTWILRETRSSNNVFCYFPRHLLFYCRRIISTLKHLPEKFFSNRQHSLEKERARAKDKITRQLQRIPRPTQ
jgi:hypothetical protein